MPKDVIEGSYVSRFKVCPPVQYRHPSYVSVQREVQNTLVKQNTRRQRIRGARVCAVNRPLLQWDSINSTFHVSLFVACFN